MKLSKQTISILQACSKLQDELFIEPGNRIRCLNPAKTVLLEATVPELFETEWCIFRLREFIRHVGEESEFCFADPEWLEVRNGNALIAVPQGHSSNIPRPPLKSIQVPQYEEAFFINQQDIDVIRTAKQKRGTVAFRSNAAGADITLACFGPDANFDLVRHFPLSRQNESANSFNALFTVGNLKVLEGSFKVELSSVGLGRFTSMDKQITIFIAMERSQSHFHITPKENLAYLEKLAKLTG